jgi:hypothetical protein
MWPVCCFVEAGLDAELTVGCAAAAAAAAGRFIDGYTLRNYTLKGLILQVHCVRSFCFQVPYPSSGS